MVLLQLGRVGEWSDIMVYISFCKTTKMDVIFNSMDEDTGKERWIKNCSILVDCILMVLRNGGDVVIR